MRTRTIAALLVLLAVGLLAAGLFPQEPLRRLVEGRLRKAVGPGTRLGRLHVVPALLRADLVDLRLEAPGLELDVPRARIQLSPSILWSPSLSLELVELHGPSLRLEPVRGSQGGSPAGLPPLIARRVVVDGGEVWYRDPALGGALRLGRLTVYGGIGEGTLTLESTEGAWEGAKALTLGPTRARLVLDPSLDARLEMLELGTPASRLRVSGDLARAGRLHPDLRLEGGLDLADAAPWIGSSLTGALRAEGRLTETAGTPRLEGTLSGRDLRLAGWTVDAAEARLGQQDGTSTLALRLELAGGRAEAEARLDPRQGSGRLRVTRLDLARLAGGALGRGTVSAELRGQGGRTGPVQVSGWLEAEGRAPGRGFVKAHVEAGGTASGPFPPRVAGEIEGNLILGSAESPVTTALTGSLHEQGERWGVALEMNGLGGRASLAAEARADRFERLSGRIEDWSLAPLAPAARGLLSLGLEGSGPLASPSFTGSGRVQDLAWGDVPLGSLGFGAEGRAGRIDFSLEAPALHATARGHLDTGRSSVLQGSLALSSAPLAPLFQAAGFSPTAGPPLTGEATATVEVTLPLARPRALSLQARVEGLKLQRGEIRANAGPFTARLSDGRLDVEDLALEGSGLRLEASGSLGLEENAPLDVRSHVALDLEALPLPVGWKRSGTVSTDLRIDGRCTSPQASGAIRLQDVTLEGPRLPPMAMPAGEIRLEGQTATTSGITAQSAGGTVTLSGRVPLAALLPSLRAIPAGPEDEADLRLAWEGLRAAALDASFSGEAQLQGGLASLAEPRASLSVPATALRVEGQDIRLEPFTIHLEKGRLSSEGITVASAGASFRLAGSLDLGRRALDLSGKGLLDLRTLSPFLAQAALTGSADVDVAVAGTLEAPLPRGEIRIRDGTLRLRDLPEPLTALQATVRFDGHEGRLEDASAALGGGVLTMTGTTTLPGFATEVQVTGRDVGLRYPPGLRSRLDADLTFSGRPGDFRLAGRVEAGRGLYDLDIALEQSLFAPVVKPTPSPLLRSIALDMSVQTRNPVLVRNNLAQLEATGQLTARGDLETPAPFGRLEIRPGGKVFLQGREFEVTRGGLTYTGSWDPEIAISAEARIRPTDEAGNYSVTVSVEGTLETPRASLSSVPRTSEGELLSLIATGRLRGEMLQSGQWIVGGQAAALLAGRLTRGVAQTLGLSEVSVRPDLLAREADPGARFTFGKDLTPRVGLIYSVGLGGPEARFFQLEGRPGRDVTLTLQRRDDGVFTYGAGQAFRWGGVALPSGPRKDESVELEAVRLEGELGLAEAALREDLRARPGRSVSPWDVQEDGDRLGERLRREDYLEAQVGARLVGRTAVFTVHSGPRYSWRVEGLPDAPDLGGVVRGALYEEEALDRGRERLLRELRRRGHLRGAVAARAMDEASGRRLVFTVAPGPRLRLAGVSFPGASAFWASRLLDAAGGASRLLTAPADAVLGIRDAYRERHYLAAQVDPPRVQESGEEIRIEVPVHEGPLARLASIRFEGAALPEDELRNAAALTPGGPYDAAAASAAATRLRDHYLGRGYPAVRVRPEAVAAGDDLELVLNVTEGPHVVVGSVEITGNRRTSEGLVRGQVRIRPGDPLDPRKLGAAERRLLDLGVFSSVIVTPTSENPATVRVEVREGPAFTAGYDLRYNDEERGTALVEGEARNVFGWALKLGGRYRVGADVREARGTLSVPALRKGALTGSVFSLEEDTGSGEGQITQRQRGFQLQQTVRLPGRWDLLAGYRFRSNTTIASNLPSLPIDVAGLDLSLVREARDSVLDPHRGSFLSLNLELAPAALGSDAPFAKGFAQLSLATPLGSSLTWAQGYRLGLSWGFGGEPVIPFERFQAGGANSLRGFGTGEVGPRDFLGEPAGGEAVVIANQELRYHHPSGLGAAVFYDVGNVFPTVREMSFDLRHTLGAGLRWASPVGLLRLDVGFPLSREPGEKAYHLFFSLGQAF